MRRPTRAQPTRHRPTRDRRRFGSGRRLVVAMLGVGCIATGCRAASAVSAVSALFGPGAQHASIRLVMTGSGSTAVSGRFAGRALVGTYSASKVDVAASLCPGSGSGSGSGTAVPGGSGYPSGNGGTLTGTVDGRSFRIDACAMPMPEWTFKIAGTVGSTVVSGQASFPKMTALFEQLYATGQVPTVNPSSQQWTDQVNQAMSTASFTGRFGSRSISGTATLKPEGNALVITADMTVG